jgi:hypothetical protein
VVVEHRVDCTSSVRKKKTKTFFPLSSDCKDLNFDNYLLWEKAKLFVVFDKVSFKFSRILKKIHKKGTIVKNFATIKAILLLLSLTVFKPFSNSAFFPKKQTYLKELLINCPFLQNLDKNECLRCKCLFLK